MTPTAGHVRPKAPVALNSWTTGDAVDARTDIRVAADAGYRFVELRDAKIEQFLASGGDLDTLRRDATQRGIGILDVNTLDDATLVTGSELDARVTRCSVLSRWARALGAPFVIAGPSYLPEGGLPRDLIRRRSVEALTRHVAAAAEHDVRIGFEFHGYARCSINTVADAMAVIEEVGDPRLGLVIDAFHFYVGGSTLADIERIDPARLFAIHLADVDHGDRTTLGKANRVLPGDGVLPLPTFVKAVRKTGYVGPFGLELFNQKLWDMAPQTIAQRGIDSMRRYV